MLNVQNELKTITQNKGAVVQSTGYYPFGLQTADSWTRDDAQGNSFLYNAGSEFNESTGNYETFFREYDPALGRMTAIDPLAAKYSSWSPYNYAFNDPVALNDPTGAEPYYNHDYIMEHEFDVAGPVPGMGNDNFVADYQDLNPFGNRQIGLSGSLGSQGLGGHIYYGSGGNWADGIRYNDWTLAGGSNSFRQGLANGLTEIGGRLYGFDDNGTKREVEPGFDGSWRYWNQYGGDQISRGEWEAITGKDGSVASGGAWYFTGGWETYGPNGETYFSPDAFLDAVGFMRLHSQVEKRLMGGFLLKDGSVVVLPTEGTIFKGRKAKGYGTNDSKWHAGLDYTPSRDRNYQKRYEVKNGSGDWVSIDRLMIAFPDISQFYRMDNGKFIPTFPPKSYRILGSRYYTNPIEPILITPRDILFWKN